MNKEKLIELSDTLRGIAEGKEWEYRLNSNNDKWLPSQNGYDPVYFAANGNLRLKPQTLPPDPYAELKAAHAAGKTIQNASFDRSGWFDTPYPKWTAPVDMYRIKPEPHKVPLGPDDVMPGCAVRSNLWCDPEWRFIAHVYLDGVLLSNCESTQSWDKLETYYLINRSIPLTGKWDKDAWEPCYKLIEE